MSFTIRRSTLDDAEALNRIGNHYILNSSANFKLVALTVHERENWIRGFKDSGRIQLFVGEEEGRIRGFCCTYPFNERPAYCTSVAVTIYLDPDFKGKGLGSALYTQLFESLAKEDIHRAYAGITLPNPASIAIHQKFGFKKVAHYSEAGKKFDQYWDVIWMEKKFQ